MPDSQRLPAPSNVMHNRPAQCRLALLYTLSQSGITLTEPQLARIMSDTSVMNFFDLKSSLHDLADGGQIEELPMLEGSVYVLTDKGAEMIETLKTDLRRSLRDSIDSYLAAHGEELYRESLFQASFTRIDDKQYRARARIVSDGAPVFELTMLLGSREEAKTFVDSWKEKGSDIYQRILLELTV